jgi:hypothetical protein
MPDPEPSNMSMPPRYHPGKNGDTSWRYPGGKGGAGVYQTLINLIPPHEVYIETHLGGGAIMRYKKPAKYNIGIDIDPDVIELWKTRGNIGISGDCFRTGSPLSPMGSKLDKNNDASRTPIVKNTDESWYRNFKNVDASSFLKKLNFAGNEFIYSDPPYLMETRKGGKLYNFEYTEGDHVKLLETLKTLSCMVMISGYYSELYNDMLQGWNTHSFTAQTRQGPATEWVWMNYPKPKELHDYSFLGKNFRERERITRKIKRWTNRLKKLPALERRAILESINGHTR